MKDLSKIKFNKNLEYVFIVIWSLFYIIPIITISVLDFNECIKEKGVTNGIYEFLFHVAVFILPFALPLLISLAFMYLAYWGLFLLSIPYWLIQLIGYIFNDNNSWLILEYGLLYSFLISLLCTVIGFFGVGYTIFEFTED